MNDTNNIKISLGDYFYTISCTPGKTCKLTETALITGATATKTSEGMTISSYAKGEKAYKLLDAYMANSCENCEKKNGLAGKIQKIR